MKSDINMSTKKLTLWPYSLGSITDLTIINAVSSKVWGNIPSNCSIMSDIEHKKIGGLETNHNCMNIIIVLKFFSNC